MEMSLNDATDVAPGNRGQAFELRSFNDLLRDYSPCMDESPREFSGPFFLTVQPIPRPAAGVDPWVYLAI